MFWVISVYFNIRNTLPKFCPLLLGHSICGGRVWEEAHKLWTGIRRRMYKTRSSRAAQYVVTFHDAAMATLNLSVRLAAHHTAKIHVGAAPLILNPHTTVIHAPVALPRGSIIQRAGNGCRISVDKVKCPASHVQTVACWPHTELPQLYIRMGFKCMKWTGLKWIQRGSNDKLIESVKGSKLIDTLSVTDGDTSWKIWSANKIKWYLARTHTDSV